MRTKRLPCLAALASSALACSSAPPLDSGAHPHVLGKTTAALTQCNVETSLDGPEPSSSPVLVARRAGVLDVLYTGPNTSVRHRSLAAGQTQWSAEEDLDGRTLGKPAAAAWNFFGDGSDRLDVFVAGGDRQLYQQYWNGQARNGWWKLGGTMKSAAAVTSWAPGRLDVMYIGDGNELRNRWFDGTTWQDDFRGGNLKGDPAAVSWGPNRIDVFARNVDDQLWHIWYDHGWGSSELLGGKLASSPTVASWGPGRLDIFWRGTDDTLRHKAFGGQGWTDEANLGGKPFLGDPAAASWGANRVDVVMQDTARRKLVRRSWFGANATLTPVDCQPGGGEIFSGTYSGYMVLEDSGFRADNEGVAAPNVRIPVTAVAGDATSAPAGAAASLRSNPWVMLTDPLSAVTSSGKILVTSAAGHQSYTDEYLVPKAHETADGLGNSGSLPARIYTDADGAPTLASGKLTGRFSVDTPLTTTWSLGIVYNPATHSNEVGMIPTTTVATQRWSFVLERTDAISSVRACGRCATGEACDARVGLCVAGKAGTSGSAELMGTLSHTLFSNWPTAVDQAVDREYSSAGASPWDVARLPNFYQPEAQHRQILLPNASLLFRERIFAKQQNVAYNLCKRDFRRDRIAASFAARPGSSRAYVDYFKRGVSDPYRGGCRVDAANFQHVDSHADLCDVIYGSRSIWQDNNESCHFFGQGHDQQKWKDSYLPCIDGNEADPATQSFNGQSVNFNCSNAHRASNRWSGAQTSYGAFLSTCAETEFIVLHEGGLAPRARHIFLCPADHMFSGNKATPNDILRDGNWEPVACYDPNGKSGASLFDSTNFGRRGNGSLAMLPVSNDASCGGTEHQAGSPPFTFPLFTAGGKRDPITSKAMLDSCAADLATPIPFGVRLASAFETSKQCISPARFFTSLRDAHGQNPAYYNRLIQQWLGMHSFLAMQGSQGQELLAALGNDMSGEPPQGPLETLPRLLAQLDDGLDLVLDRTVTPALIAGANAGDYRRAEEWWIPTGDFGKGDQGVSLAITLVETAKTYLGAQTQQVVKTSEATAGKCSTDGAIADRTTVRARAGRTLRYAAAINGLADAIAKATTGNRMDLARWGRARRELEAARQNLIDQTIDMANCKAPVRGVESDDIPIVFNDPQTTTSRFFASSDYFRGLARTEVTSASSKLGDARSAWINARNSKIQTITQAVEMERRVADLNRQYATSIIEMCGLPDDAQGVLALFDPTRGRLNAESCYVPAGVNCASETDAKCYRGTMGEDALAIVAANKDVTIAKSAWADAETSYNTQFSRCLDKQESLDIDGELSAAHVNTIKALQDAKAVADSIAVAMEAAKECASAVALMTSAGGKCAAGIAGSAAKIVGISYQKDIEQANALYEHEKSVRQSLEMNKDCFHEADQRKIGIDTAAQQIQRRQIEVQAAILRLTNAKSRVRQLVMEGTAAVAREKARAVPSVEHHYWLNEHVESFRQQFAWAKHLTFLALKATEHDYQQSLSLRDAVLKAQNPTELESALRVIDDQGVSKSIAGNSPGTQRKVFSLRDNLVGFYGDGDTGTERPAAIAKLRDLLGSTKSDIRDETNALVGKGIPFTLAPDQTDSDRCAERLWRVILGYSGDSVTPDNAPINMRVFKKNTFSSNWCTGRGTPRTMQVGFARPLGYFYGGHGGRAPEAAAPFAKAKLDMWQPIQKSDLSNEQYTSTGSSELAGRGLFGDYVIVFPASELPRLDLQRIEDIWVRFDYEDVSR